MLQRASSDDQVDVIVVLRRQAALPAQAGATPRARPGVLSALRSLADADQRRLAGAAGDPAAAGAGRADPAVLGLQRHPRRRRPRRDHRARRASRGGRDRAERDGPGAGARRCGRPPEWNVARVNAPRAVEPRAIAGRASSSPTWTPASTRPIPTSRHAGAGARTAGTTPTASIRRRRPTSAATGHGRWGRSSAATPAARRSASRRTRAGSR